MKENKTKSYKSEEEIAEQYFNPDERIPKHIAVIMDGNGRWARERGLPRIAGHKKGAEVVKRLVRSCKGIGVSYVTIYAFSSENWKRPKNEVKDLMGLFRLYIKRELSSLAKDDVRIRFIGNRSKLDPDIKKLIDNAELKTANNGSLTFTVALNYGSRQEIVDAVMNYAKDVESGKHKPEEITEGIFERYFQSAGLPDPDLLIRTSGEQRISNFLLWQSAYTEFAFLPVMWPDFEKAHLLEAVGEYQRRERRYGGEVH